MARATHAGVLVGLLMLTGAPVGAQSDADLAREDRISDLERKVEILTEELERVRSEAAVPSEPSGYSARYGYAPAASKVYGLTRGLSLGGYGEGYYTNFLHDDGAGADPDRTEKGPALAASEALDQTDLLRLVLYVGYKFSENIVFNSEIEFEHARTGGAGASAGEGSVSVELAALDFFLHDAVNARAGLLLLPMGFLNEIHEPPFFHGVQRPEVETRIIPSTWRENGAGVFGHLGEDLEYRAYVVNGFAGSLFTDRGVRDGRQNGNRAFAEDLGFVARLDWTPTPGWLLGGSVYTGKSGQDLETPAGVRLPGARFTLWELHGQYRRGGLETRALFSLGRLANADDLNLALARPADAPIAERMLGGYLELAYDVWPWLFESEKYLAPFLRVEYVDTQDEVPGGFTANRNRAFWLATTGLSFKPHPNVVLKAEYRNFQARSGDIPDELSVGMGFAF